MGSPTLGRTTGILLAGGIAGLWSWQNENPDQIVRFLDGSVLETPIDVGDVYANGLVVGDAVMRPGFGRGLLDRIAVGQSGVGLRVKF